MSRANEWSVRASGMRGSAFWRSYRPLWDGALPAPTAARTIADLDAVERAEAAFACAALLDVACTAPRRAHALAALARLGVAGE